MGRAVVLDSEAVSNKVLYWLSQIYSRALKPLMHYYCPGGTVGNSPWQPSQGGVCASSQEPAWKCTRSLPEVDTLSGEGSSFCLALGFSTIISTVTIV